MDYEANARQAAQMMNRLGTMGTTIGGTTAPRLAMLPQEVAGAEKRVEGLHNLLCELEGRLSDYARQETPQVPTAQTPEVPHPEVPVVACLMQLNARLDHACARIQSLMQRLEV